MGYIHEKLFRFAKNLYIIFLNKFFYAFLLKDSPYKSICLQL